MRGNQKEQTFISEAAQLLRIMTAAPSSEPALPSHHGL
jgi:hypothetical protein